MTLQLTTSDLSIAHHVTYIENLVQRGGPEPKEWSQLNDWIESIAIALKENLISEDGLNDIRKAFGASFSLNTIQGFSFLKPRGYAGDFEVIDRVYMHYLSDNPNLRRWDEFLQAKDCSKAVRNRKAYFKKWVLQKCAENTGKTLKLLNLASGPGRDVAELLIENPMLKLEIDCVEWDVEAIRYAKSLLPPAADVKFIHQNIFKFTAERSYDLIWSAGLFDYFDDVTFELILNRILKWVNPGGEITIGNFKYDYGTYCYLELMDWHLHYRSANDLLTSAINCGVSPECIDVKAEPLRANLFLHIADKCE